jgi:DNA polymerase-3 subunit chi
VTDVGFYQLGATPLDRALPKLLERALGAGFRTVVLAPSQERIDHLDAVLWTYDDSSFLPHGTARDGEAARQPIWLTTEDENPNGATMLVLVDGMTSQRLADYRRCLDIFDASEDGVAAARDRWCWRTDDERTRWGRHDSRRKLLLRRSRAGGHRVAGGHGLLPLPFLSFVVRRARERLQPLEAGGGADHIGSRAPRDVPKDRIQPASVLREMRRAPDDQSSHLRIDRRFRGDTTGVEIYTRRTCKLR